MMWTRAELKTRARFTLKHFYWRTVVAALVMRLVLTGLRFGSKRDKNADTQEQIKEFFVGRYIGFYAFFAGLTAIMVLLGAVVTLAAGIFILNPLEIGCKRYFMDAGDGAADLSNLGMAFRNGYANVVAVVLIRNIAIFLWTLLLVVPGIVKAYEYRMIGYILADNPDMTYTEARDRSRIMMQGEKWNAFVFDLSFIGWYILSGITKGLVGTFFTNPYKELANAQLYKTLCAKAD